MTSQKPSSQGWKSFELENEEDDEDVTDE